MNKKQLEQLTELLEQYRVDYPLISMPINVYIGYVLKDIETRID